MKGVVHIDGFVDTAKVPKHVSVQFGRKQTSPFTLDPLTYSSLVLFQA